MVNRECKVNPIKKYLRGLNEEVVQYIGIAADEPKRLLRLKANHISLLNKYGYTENMAADLCRKYGLLSPIYETGTRGGCWFCPNAKISSLCLLRKLHPELWDDLYALRNVPNLCSYGFKWGITLEDMAKKMDKHDLKADAQRRQLSLFDPIITED